MAATTHPDIAALVCPSLRLRRIEGRKYFFHFLNPLCGFSRREGGPAKRWPGESSPAFPL